MDTLILNFSKLTLPQIYSIQQVATIEIRIRETIATSQAYKVTRKAREQKKLINRQRADLEAQAQRQASLEQAINKGKAKLFDEVE